MAAESWSANPTTLTNSEVRIKVQGSGELMETNNYDERSRCSFVDGLGIIQQNNKQLRHLTLRKD